MISTIRHLRDVTTCYHPQIHWHLRLWKGEQMRTGYTHLTIEFSIEDVSFSALNIVFEHFTKPIPKHSHSRNSFEIHYIPYGKGTVIINDQTYEVTPNTLYITGPHVQHEQLPDKEDPMAEYCIYLKIKQKDCAKNNNTSSSYISLFTNTPLWFGQDREDLHSLLKQIFYEFKNEYSGYMTQVVTLLQQCIVKIIRNYEHEKESQRHFAPSSLVDSKYIIVEESFLYEFSNLSLEMLASRLCLSTRQTERFLKDYYGKTFLQKILEAKMSAAAIQLSGSKQPITNIAYDLGYSSVEHFSHAFKRYYGITAREYRKQNHT